MASSADSPEYARQRRQWALWRELLPGIEEYLIQTLSQEKLSVVAEERRKYFVERLDILKLPPTLPPRAGKRLSVELLEESEETCGTPVHLLPELSGLLPELNNAKPELSEAEKDFAAQQREISRNLLASVSSEQDVADGIEETDSAKGVKVYDDIDPSESTAKGEEGDDEDEDDINALYEIPIARQEQPQHPHPHHNQLQHPTSEDDPADPATTTSNTVSSGGLTNAGSVDDINDDVLVDVISSSPSGGGGGGGSGGGSGGSWLPPPLPPRTTRKKGLMTPRGESESSDRASSTNSLDRARGSSGAAIGGAGAGVGGGVWAVAAAAAGGGGGGGGTVPPNLPFRPPLPRRNELYARSERSDKSEKSEKSDVSDGDSTSYESFDENENDTELMSKPSVKLPKRPKKKTKTSSKLLSSKARSSSTWEINVPFKKLDSVVVSGEMQHKGKLSWNRRLVAISNGCMAMYKPDKETRPVFVIPLTGFSASIGDPLGRKGFEMKMSHADSGESYTFAVDFKEWANMWCEKINGISRGLSVTSYPQHLARTFSGGGSENSAYGSKKIDVRLGEEAEEEGEGDYEVYEKYITTSATTTITSAASSTDNSSVFSTPPLTPTTPRFDHSNQPPRGSARASLRSTASVGRLPKTGKALPLPQHRSFSGLTASARTASTLTLSRWDWKTLFYNWAFPFDSVVTGVRRGNLSNSNSNLSLSSEGVESDDSSKPRLRANKVMRMGSFAYRATQFFENLGKKSTSKRKVSSLSSPSGEGEFNLRSTGIQEESSLSSSSIGLPAISPSSDATSPVFLEEEMFQHPSTLSSPSPPPLPTTPPPSKPPVLNIKHQGYLNIFSSFNKRRWGQRWCLVRENMFECYRNQTSQLCELNFLLRKCILRQAMAETSSPLAVMLLEDNREKITVEPPTKEELGQWLRVLMRETSTEGVPEGLEEFFVEAEDPTFSVEAEYTDIVGASVIKSWEVGGIPILPSQQDNTATSSSALSSSATADNSNDASAATTAGVITGDSSATAPDNNDDDHAQNATADQPQPADAAPEKYLYTEVVKRSSSSALLQLAEDVENEEKDQREAEKEKEEEEEDKEEGEVEKIPRFTDNLAVYNANKNTTDSGFYSVKGANSDSDSGSEAGKTTISSPAQESCSSFSIQEDEGRGTLPKNSTNSNAFNNNSDTRISDSAPAPAASGEEKDKPEGDDVTTNDVVTSANNSKDSAVVAAEGGSEVILGAVGGSDAMVDSYSNTERGIMGDVRKDDVDAVPFGLKNGIVGDGCADVSSEDFSSDGRLDQDMNEEHHIYAQIKSEDISVETTTSTTTTTTTTADGVGDGGHVEDIQPRSSGADKGKKKKRKSKSKKPKHDKHASLPPHENLPSDNAAASNTKSKPDGSSRNPQTPRIPATGSSTNDSSSVLQQPEGAESSTVSPSSSSSSVQHRNNTVTPATDNHLARAPSETSALPPPTAAAATRDHAGEEDGAKHSQDNEVVSELRDRIGRLREKLVQIKRKRIAVRDKRVRAFSAEERAVCDKEYLTLEAECKETAATIQNLEGDLRTAMEATAGIRS